MAKQVAMAKQGSIESITLDGKTFDVSGEKHIPTFEEFQDEVVSTIAKAWDITGTLTMACRNAAKSFSAFAASINPETIIEITHGKRRYKAKKRRIRKKLFKSGRRIKVRGVITGDSVDNMGIRGKMI